MDDVVPGDATLAPAVQVLFDLPQEGDWPPVSSEPLGALLVAHDTAQLQESPFFARHVAKGDLLRVRSSEDGSWQPVERLKPSGSCTIRIVPFRKGPLSGSRERVLDAFAPLGVSGKGHGRFRIVALDVPSTVDLVATKRVLYDGVDAGWWDYEEGCLTDAWLATEPDRGWSGE
ncbi:DUF4265 domain-containing protein [Dactylosporangium sp. NPDC000244]|uniref:DUF4265 domain-containing protein n=1 Tax=Dactylosporangium sp. NPDC000244 TaxID=3154365 RepID=UPI00331AF937